MSTRDMYDWYSEADLCTLKMQTDKEMSLKKYRIRNCTAARKLPNVVYSNKLICAVGMNLGRSCEAPLPQDSFYLQKLKEKNLGNPLSGNLLRVFKRITPLNIPIVFIGDSISKQNQESIICESLRTNLNGPVSMSGNLDLNMKENLTSFTLYWKRTKQKLDIYFIRVLQLRQVRLNEVKEHIKEILSKHWSLIIVANIGTWYNSREKYRADIEPFLFYMNSLGANNLVLYRETASQHWNFTSNGYFASGANRYEGGCAPLNDASPDMDWKNKDVKNIITNENLHNIHIIPFRDITAPLYNMHLYNDCTSFCYFPQLWQVVYYFLDDLTKNFVFKENIETITINNSTSTTPIPFNYSSINANSNSTSIVVESTYLDNKVNVSAIDNI